MDLVKVRAPATVANVVCGFDVLGFALETPYDEVTLRRIDERCVRILHQDDFGLPTDPEKNVAGVVLKAVLEQANADFGFEIEITKRIRPGGGLGSSAASASAAIVAANELLGHPFSKRELVELAMEGEVVSSGTRHADNVAPCIYGGFTLVRSMDPLDIVEIEHPPLFASAIQAGVEVLTSAAREILPLSVPLKDAIRQSANLGSLVAGLASGDHELIARSLVDHIAEPLRKSLIPMFDELRAAATEAGALGGGIAGSGPTVFMLSVSLEKAEAVALAMEKVYSAASVKFRTYVSPIASNGVQIIEG